MTLISLASGLRQAQPLHKLPESFAKAGQDLFGIELEEAGLVITGGVEDQVCEAKLYVRTDLFDVFFRIARDKPTAMRLICNLLGSLLHFACIMDIGLIFG